MNNVILSGRITKDPDVKFTNNTNAAYCQFSLAVRNDYKNNDGNYDSQFIECSAFNGTATYMQNYVHKGDMLIIKGRINVQNYVDKDGKNRTSTNVSVESMENVTPRQTQQQPQPTNQPQAQQPKKQAYPNNANEMEKDDTIPWL